MLYEEASEKLNEMERLEIAKSIYNGKKSEFARSEAGEAFHNILSEMSADDLYEEIEGLEYLLTCKIIEDNF